MEGKGKGKSEIAFEYDATEVTLEGKGVIVFEYDATEVTLEGLVDGFIAGIEDIVAVVDAYELTEADGGGA